MNKRQWVLSFAASVTLVVLLMPTVIAWAAGDGNSAWVKIGSGEKQADLSVGDILGDAKIVDGKCSVPDMSMGIGGDLSSLRVGVDSDTCKVIVRSIVASEGGPATSGLDGESISANSTQRWWVEALTKVVGINSIDDLTKTRTSLEFTRAPGAVYDGGNTLTDCWGNHTLPGYYYYVDDCLVNAHDFVGQYSVFIRLKGTYTHTLYPPFGHFTTAKAEGTVTQNRAVCEGGSLPFASDLECELDSALLN